jgi:hypothetical protein
MCFYVYKYVCMCACMYMYTNQRIPVSRFIIWFICASPTPGHMRGMKTYRGALPDSIGPLLAGPLIRLVLCSPDLSPPGWAADTNWYRRLILCPC